MRLLHVYISMFMLVIMLFFTVTGITLNHPDWFSSSQAHTKTTISIPNEFQASDLWGRAPEAQTEGLLEWLQANHNVHGQEVDHEWIPDEQLLVVDIKQPGGYSLVEVDVTSGLAYLEVQQYGLVATLNDLHKGRNSGQLWRLFIDVSAIAMLLFTLTGFWLVIPQKKKRKALLTVSVLGASLMGFTYLGVI